MNVGNAIPYSMGHTWQLRKSKMILEYRGRALNNTESDSEKLMTFSSPFDLPDSIRKKTSVGDNTPLTLSSFLLNSLISENWAG